MLTRGRRSAKLGEENKRIKAARAAGRTLPDKAAADAASDDEGSVVTELTRAHNSCGACRTRESEVWWKAPKGLPTGVLCDNCGLSWRKYADLNVRPIREEVGPAAKAKTENKREGTPLNGPSAKRAKVGCLSVCVVSRAREMGRGGSRGGSCRRLRRSRRHRRLLPRSCGASRASATGP